MNTIRVHVGRCENNYCACWTCEPLGVIIVTHQTLKGLKEDFSESLRFSIDGWLEDGDPVPSWLSDGDYEISFDLDTTALLHEASRYTTLEAIGHASGINPKQLSHYVTGVKKPRPYQRERIIAGLHTIAATFMAMQ